MMEQPDALNLLRTASSALIGEVLEQVADDKRLPVLMIAKAIAIAVRELEQSVDDRRAVELAQLQDVYSGDSVKSTEATPTLPQRRGVAHSMTNSELSSEAICWR